MIPFAPNPLLLPSALAASALVSAVWQGILLALAVLCLLKLFPAIPAATRSALWTVTFVLAAALDLTPVLPLHSAAAAPPLRPVHMDLRWAFAVAALWIVCSTIRAAQLLLSAFYLRRLARLSLPVADLPAFAQNLPRHAVVCASDQVDRPCVTGFFRPRILFPPALLASLSAAELEQVLLHETEHLRRADDWTNLAQKLALVVFPLNPVLLWVERRLCLERELACDDRVLAHASVQTATRRSYAQCLVHLAEHTALTRRLHRGLSLALGAWGRRSELARRVYRILSLPPATLSRPRAAALTGALTAGLLGCAASLAHAPELVSFTPVSTTLSATDDTPATASAGQTPHLQYVRAVLPSRPSPLPRPVSATIRRRPRRRTAVLAPPRLLTTVAPAEPRLLRLPQMTQVAAMVPLPPPAQHDTETPQATAAVSRAAVGRAPAFVPVITYAAVPLPGGWLLIQL